MRESQSIYTWFRVPTGGADPPSRLRESVGVETALKEVFLLNQFQNCIKCHSYTEVYLVGVKSTVSANILQDGVKVVLGYGYGKVLPWAHILPYAWQYIVLVLGGKRRIPLGKDYILSA